MKTLNFECNVTPVPIRSTNNDPTEYTLTVTARGTRREVDTAMNWLFSKRRKRATYLQKSEEG